MAVAKSSPPAAVRARATAGLLRKTRVVVAASARAFLRDHAPTHSAALAFCFVLSFAPMLVLLLWLTSWVAPEHQERVIDHLAGCTGLEATALVASLAERTESEVRSGDLLGWISVGTLVVSAGAVFTQLQTSLNAMWNVRAPTDRGDAVLGWLRKRVLSLGVVLSFGCLLAVSFVPTSLLDALVVSPQRGAAGNGWQVVVGAWLAPFLIHVVGFVALFRYVPDARLAWRDAVFGAVVTAALFLVGGRGIDALLQWAAVGASYGAASSLFVLLVWSYYAAAIVLFGAELTQAVVRARGERIPSAGSAARA